MLRPPAQIGLFGAMFSHSPYIQYAMDCSISPKKFYVWGGKFFCGLAYKEGGFARVLTLFQRMLWRTKLNARVPVFSTECSFKGQSQRAPFLLLNRLKISR